MKVTAEHEFKVEAIVFQLIGCLNLGDFLVNNLVLVYWMFVLPRYVSLAWLVCNEVCSVGSNCSSSGSAPPKFHNWPSEQSLNIFLVMFCEVD